MNPIDRITRPLMTLAATAAVAGCAGLPVTVDTNPNANPAMCHTYLFAQEHSTAPGGAGGAYGNPLNGDRLRAAIAANLAAHGIQPATDRTSADCVVGYAIGSRVVADEFAGSFGWGWGWGWRQGYYGAAYDWPAVRNEGRITVDLFDAKGRMAIWHASVEQNVTDLTGPNAELKINAAAAAIFAKFPVPAVPAAPAPAPAPAGKTT